MIYLDSAATARPLEYKNKSCPLDFEGSFFNPSALYSKEIIKKIDDVREYVAHNLGVGKSEIYFTSGATESNNIAILGGVRQKNLSVVLSSGEHASVYEPAMHLKNKGYRVELAEINKDTTINQADFIKLASSNCGFASLIHVSNETGAINDVESIFTAIKKKNPNVILHSDGVQGFLRQDINLKKMGVDLYSISGHKIGAPKGIGILYIKKGVVVNPLVFGGSQEKCIRAGTENVESILALAGCIKEYKALYKKVDSKDLRDVFLETISVEAKELSVKIVFTSDNSLSFAPNIVSMSVIGCKSEILQRVLMDKDNIYIGIGSACAASKKSNRVLESAKKPKYEVESNLRISFDLSTKTEEVKFAAKQIVLRASEMLKGRLKVKCPN